MKKNFEWSVPSPGPNLAAKEGRGTTVFNWWGGWIGEKT